MRMDLRNSWRLASMLVPGRLLEVIGRLPAVIGRLAAGGSWSVLPPPCRPVPGWLTMARRLLVTGRLLAVPDPLSLGTKRPGGEVGRRPKDGSALTGGAPAVGAGPAAAAGSGGAERTACCASEGWAAGPAAASGAGLEGACVGLVEAGGLPGSGTSSWAWGAALVGLSSWASRGHLSVPRACHITRKAHALSTTPRASRGHLSVPHACHSSEVWHMH